MHHSLPTHSLLSLSDLLSAESGLTYTQSEMGVDGESGWRVVMTSQTVGRLPALSRPARDEPTDITNNNNNNNNREVRTVMGAETQQADGGCSSMSTGCRTEIDTKIFVVDKHFTTFNTLNDILIFFYKRHFC